MRETYDRHLLTAAMGTDLDKSGRTRSSALDGLEESSESPLQWRVSLWLISPRLLTDVGDAWWTISGWESLRCIQWRDCESASKAHL
jgi:hypothetical protein